MKYLSLFLTILFLSLIWACTNEENLESSSNQDLVTESSFSFISDSGPINIDLSNPSNEVIKAIRKGGFSKVGLSRNTISCTPPCETDRTFIFSVGASDICGSPVGPSCQLRVELSACFQEVTANNTVEIFIDDAEVTFSPGCTGADEDCLRAYAISQAASSVVQSINFSFPELPDPLACGGPTVNWVSTYSESSCRSNCEGVDCGIACCQFYTSWCQGDDGEILVGQFEGSNQISDCSGNSDLPEGCECFQTNCENQYDF
jgi:hypothetical protein